YAQVAGFNHYAHALGIDSVLNRLRKLHSQTFLDLQTARKDVNKPGNFAQSQDLAIRNIGDMYFAKKRQQMVLAETEHLNVLNDDHFVIGHVEERALKHFVGVLLIA